MRSGGGPEREATPSERSPRPLPEASYAASGVDRERVHLALNALLRASRYRPPPSHGRVIPAPGHFSGLVRIGRETVAITTDTVGTKVLLAERLRRYEEVGEDLVSVNVNDLAAVGARPAGLVDVISCARADPDVFAAIGRGIGRGLRLAPCSLLGGESAVVPDLVRGLDLGGTAIGFFPRGRAPVTGERIRVGDLVLGIPSSGFHANGYTLVRKLVEESSLDLRRPRSGSRMPLGLELLQPTRCYTRIAEALAERSDVHGFAHISGGGVRNLARLTGNVDFVLDQWPVPEGPFQWIQDLGQISMQEIYQTFNVGIGFVVVTAPAHLAELKRRLARAGAPDASVVGHVARGRGVHLPQVAVDYPGYS